MRKTWIFFLLSILNPSWGFDEEALLSYREFVDSIFYSDQSIYNKEQKIIQHQIITELLRNNEIEDLFPISQEDLKLLHQEKFLELHTKLLKIIKNRFQFKFALSDFHIIETLGNRLNIFIHRNNDSKSLSEIYGLMKSVSSDYLRKNRFIFDDNFFSYSAQVRDYIIDRFPWQSFSDSEILLMFSRNSSKVNSLWFAKAMNQLQPSNKNLLAQMAIDKMFMVDHAQVKTWLSEFIINNGVADNQVYNIVSFEEYIKNINTKEFTTSTINIDNLWTQFLNFQKPTLGRIQLEDQELLKEKFILHFSSFEEKVIKVKRLEQIFDDFLNDSFEGVGDFKSVPFSLDYYIKGYSSENKYLNIKELFDYINSRKKYSHLELEELFLKVFIGYGNFEKLTDESVINILKSIVEQEIKINPVDFDMLKHGLDSNKHHFRNRLEKMLLNPEYKLSIQKIFQGKLGSLSSILMPATEIKEVLKRIKDGQLGLTKINQAINLNLINDLNKLSFISQSTLKDELLNVFNPEEAINLYEFLKAKMIVKDLESFNKMREVVEGIELLLSRRLSLLDPEQRKRFIRMYENPMDSFSDNNIIIPNQDSEYFLAQSQKRFNVYDREINENIMREERIIPLKILNEDLSSDVRSKYFKLAIEILSNQDSLSELQRIENLSKFKRLVFMEKDPKNILLLMASLKGHFFKNAMIGFEFSDKGMSLILENYAKIRESGLNPNIDLSKHFKPEYIELIQNNAGQIEENIASLIDLISEEKIKLWRLKGSIIDSNRAQEVLSLKEVAELFKQSGMNITYYNETNSIKYTRSIKFDAAVSILIQNCFDDKRSN
ncbi:hypothetical protein N9N67_06840 [Bacteriovoracaceae bacterium]|nr:hypothetical protein [Bacteriovoracaceae bacterium]